MGARGPWMFEIFLTCLLFSSGPSISEKPALAPRKITSKRMLLLSSSSTQLDDVPIVNPTTPGYANPSPSAPTTPQGPFITGPNPTNSAPQAPTTPESPFMNGPNPTNSGPQIPPTPQGPFTTGPNPTNSPQTPTIPQGPPTTGPNPTNSPPQTTNPNTPTTTTPSQSGGSWCIASQTASPTALQTALDYACGYGGADCSAIQPGGRCYQPNTVRDHASYAFNDFYQKHPSPTSCSFGGTAQVANTDPSQGNCHFSSSSSQSTSKTPPAAESPPNLMTPMSPAIPSAPNMTMSGGSSGFGLEPTGSFSSATSIAYSISLILFTAITHWDSLVAESYI